jgi:hypothetical protein
MDDFLNTHEGAAVPDGEASAPHGIAYRSTADIARSGAGPDAAAAAKTIEQVNMEHCMRLPFSLCQLMQRQACLIVLGLFAYYVSLRG